MRRVVTVPIYKGKLVILLSAEREYVVQHIEDFGSGNIFGHFYARPYGSYYGYYVILNPEHEDLTHGVIAHEALHAACYILNYRGVEDSYRNDEPLAYLLEWITDEIYKALGKLDRGRVLKRLNNV